MSTIALITCTSSKKPYRCEAKELYSESPRFRLAYSLAKLKASKIFILSSKYGLVPDNKIIEPYNETLSDKSIEERKEWSNKVIRELAKVTNINEDEYIILAGKNYAEFLLPYLKKYSLPLKGKQLGEWVPELERLIKLETKKSITDTLHILFNKMSRLNWTDISHIPYNNGIYIMFEKSEKYHGMDRIVRVGTHVSQNRLKQRLADHFINKDKDGSIFRKNIGRAFLYRESNPYLKIWDIDMHIYKNVQIYRSIRDLQFESQLEDKISEYIKNNITFICLPIDDKNERLRLEEGIIAVLSNDPLFKSSNNWLGLNSPILEISRSGLWNVQGLTGKPLNSTELDEICKIIKNQEFLYTHNYQYNKVTEKKNFYIADNNNASSPKISTEDIRQYIEKLINKAKANNLKYVDIISGEVHKKLGLKNRMPQVCEAMYSKKKPNDIILHTTPSGKSSTIMIRYYIY